MLSSVLVIYYIIAAICGADQKTEGQQIQKEYAVSLCSGLCRHRTGAKCDYII